jgi:RHS repeat-associated protein
MPHHSATPSHRSRTKLRMSKCSRARSPIAQAVTYQHDASGALTSDGLRRYEFDAANRLAAMTVGAIDTSPTTRYVHNALGQRLFKTEPQFPPAAGDENDPAFMASLIAFFSNLWGGNTGAANPSASEKLGFQYFYDEDGSLLYELGSGGANSTGSAHYVYLPTPSGPMPIAFYNGSKHYAVQTDHLNTPRRLTNSSKQVAWQWAFSAFGDEQPTTGKNRYVDPATTPNAGSTTIADVTFNLRYPGQYFDKESGLSYNYFRSYDSRTGRYSQSDPIDLAGGWNRFAYVGQNTLSGIDPFGLFEIIRPNGSPKTFAEAAALGRRESVLRRYGEIMQKKINSLCPEDRAKLQKIFDKWQVYVEPNIDNIYKRDRSAYGYTSFSKQQTVFNGGFFDQDFYENGGPAFTFAHEFRHLMDTNNALGGVIDLLGTGPGEVDADNFAKKFTSSSCTCGLK